MPAAIKAIRSDTVPFTTAMPCLQPCIAAKRLSNSATSRPCNRPHFPLRNTRNSRRSSSLSKTGQDMNGRVRVGFLVIDSQALAHVDDIILPDQFMKAQPLVKAE